MTCRFFRRMSGLLSRIRLKRTWLPQALFFALVAAIGPNSAAAAEDALQRAINCAGFDECAAAMLEATSPRKPEAINVAAARIGEMPKPAAGNKKAAKEANARGLALLKAGALEPAVDALREAVDADPSDVEAQANFGFVLLRAGRAKEALAPLRMALRLNPRRTSSWIPMSDYFRAAGNDRSAVGALLLGYEFSDNKTKTVSYFEAKVAERTPESPVYAAALAQVAAPSEAPGPRAASTDDDPPLSKREAREKLVAAMKRDPDYQDPDKREMFSCMAESALESIYGLRKQMRESEMKSEYERIRADPAFQLRAMRCVLNSKAIERAIAEKGGRAAGTEPQTKSAGAPLVDIDDVNIDRKSLTGKRICVSGLGQYAMGNFFLRKTATDMNPIVIDIANVPRDQQRRALAECADMMAGCRITVQGTLATAAGFPKLVADSLEW